MIEEIRLRDFPWDKIPWALDENGNRYIPGYVRDDALVLLLSKSGTIVAYLSYDVWSKVGKVEIHYVHTHLPCQKKGYATELMNWVFQKYSSEYEIHALKTSGVSESSLRRWGFECRANMFWVRRSKKQDSQQSQS